MLLTHKNAEFCVTTRHMTSCIWCVCYAEPCGDTLPPLTTSHATSYDIKLRIFMCPWHYTYFIKGLTFCVEKEYSFLTMLFIYLFFITL